MNKSFIHIINFFVKNNKLHSFLFFLFISTILWLLSQFSENYIYTYQLPVIYTDNKALVLPDFYQKDTLKIKISTTGYGLLALKLKKPEFKYVLNKMKNKNFWQPEDDRSQIRSLLGNEVKILEIYPKKIKLLKGINSKTVPVKVLIKINFSPSFRGRKTPDIQPDKVNIYGSPELLKNIDTIKTKKYTLDNIHSDINKSLDLDIPENLIVNPKQIHFHLDVGQVISEQKTLHISPLPKNFNKEILFFPTEVRLKYRFFRADYPKIKNVIFKAGINLNRMKSGDSLIKIELLDSPKEIFDIQLIPEYAKILIKK